MDINNINQIQRFAAKIGQEIYENGELSPSSKAILRSISVQNIRSYREAMLQMLSQELQKANTPEKQELAQAIMNLARAFGNEDRWLKECLDILCDNKGNTLINKLLRHFSQKVDSLVIVQDTSEIDNATYQKMRSDFQQWVQLFMKAIKDPTLANAEKGKEFLRNSSVEDIRVARETLRKFALKAIDTETEIYAKIPSAWRAEAKRALKSVVNLFAGVLDENLIYDCLQIVLNEGISDKAKESELFKRLARQLNNWAAQKKFYVRAASKTNSIKTLNWTEELIDQLNDDNSQQIQQLQEEIKQLREQIQELEEKQKRNPDQRESNYYWNEQIREIKNQLAEKEAKQINLQDQGGKSQKPAAWQKSFFGNFDNQQAQELENFAQRMEKFDQQPSAESKLSGGTVALIICGCLLGGGLIAFLLWLAFRKKKN